jgi:hypothetical protein
MRSFTCAEACARSAAAASLALEPPACAAGDNEAAPPGPRVKPPPPLAPADVAALRALWRSIDIAFQARPSRALRHHDRIARLTLL